MSEIIATWGNFASLYKDVNATKVAKEIYSMGNEVKPEQLVNFARDNEESELHKCFTWDDSVAAEKYRIYEARQVFCNLKIEIREPEKQEPKQLRISYKTDGAGYKPTTIILQNPDEYDKLLERVRKELRTFSNKYSYLKEFSPIWEAINNL